MRKFTLFTLSLICSLFVVSCSDEIINNISDSYDDATIEVSEKALEYGKEGGQKTFTVTVNEKNNFIVQWMNTVEWGKITREGNIVTVTVEANEVVKSRTAQILIFTQNGGLQKFVNITQTETDLIFDAIPDEIEFTRIGGDKIIEVTTNATDWTVEGGADWLNVESKFAIGEVKLTAQKSDLEQERATVITLKKGAITKEINIIQKGSKELVLPYQNFGSLLHELVKFEEERGNLYQFIAGGIFNKEGHHIATLSTMMPFIILDIDANTGYYRGAKMLNSFSSQEEVDNYVIDYGELLTDNGYTKNSTLEYNIFLENIQSNVLTTLYLDSVVFKVTPNQSKPMPTFDEFPYGYMNWGASEAEVRVHETSIGGTYNIAESDGVKIMVFNAKAADPDVSVRVYFFNTATYTNFVQNATEFKSTDKIYYFGKDGKRYITNEYAALLKKEGFKFSTYDKENDLEVYAKPSPKGGDWHIFAYHETDGTSAAIQIGEGEIKSSAGVSPFNMQDLDVTKMGYRTRDRHAGSDKSSQSSRKDILK